MNSIIIPTRNRENLVQTLLAHLDRIIFEEYEVIVVDSSDNLSKPKLKFENIFVEYLHTNIKSAAIQRNIGIEFLNAKTEILFFLDDDVFPNKDYFTKLENTLRENRYIGISGIALNPRQTKRRSKPTGFKGFVHRIFLLDSKKEGKLLKSGVNIPVRNYGGRLQEVDWLIGCSAWKLQSIMQTRFESDFKGASLAEDVVFSVRMSKKGKLAVDPKIILDHFEDSRGRPQSVDFWEMWVTNRYRVIEVAEFGWVGRIAFWWSTLGQMVINLILGIREAPRNFDPVTGIIRGSLKIVQR